MSATRPLTRPVFAVQPGEKGLFIPFAGPAWWTLSKFFRTKRRLANKSAEVAELTRLMSTSLLSFPRPSGSGLSGG